MFECFGLCVGVCVCVYVIVCVCLSCFALLPIYQCLCLGLDVFDVVF